MIYSKKSDTKNSKAVLKMTRDELLVEIEKAKRENVTKLDLSAKNIIELPADIQQLKNLRELDLDNNKLQRIPVEISELTNLEILYLSGNKLKSIPVELTQLVFLKTLALSSNKLKSIPVEIGELQNLERLDLDNNQLKNIPIEIGELQNLERLDLNNNQLQDIPYQLYQLKNLIVLDVRNNPGQAHIKDQSEREKIFSLKESLRAALKRFLLMLSLDLSLLRRLRETCRMILKFAGESPLRMRQSSSLNVTSSTQWSEFSIPQCARTA